MALADIYPAAFVEPAAETLSDLLMAEVKQPIDISKIAPQVAEVSPLIQAAQQRTATQAGLGTLQFDPTTGAVSGVGTGTGVASYEPYLQAAQAATDPSGYQAYMSPYQQEVIDATQALLDEQRAKGRAQLASTAITAGAFGGGREGIARAEYERGRDISDVGILSQLRQAGFEQARTAAQQQVANQLNLARQQQALETGITSQLGATGAGAQQFAQSLLEAGRQQNVLGLEYPLARLSTATNILSPLIRGAASAPTPSAPLLTNPAIAGIQGLAGTYGLLQGPTQAATSGLGNLLRGI